MNLLPFSLLRGAGFAAAALSLVLVGCGESLETVTVKGRVTVDGEPVPKGSITFMSKDGAVVAGGGTITDGAYEAQTPPGDKWVMVLATRVVRQEPMYEGDPNSPMQDVTEQITSPVYNAAHQTPLEANVDGPKEDLNFELTKSVKPRA